MRIFAVALLALVSLSLHAQTPVKLKVDATDATRRLFHVQMSMPAKPGAMTLLYPEWIPGEHGPTGPIANLVGLKIQAGGKTVAWKRDSDNMYAFHLEVPSGASTTTELAVLNWNQVLLYPKGSEPDAYQYQATLIVPNSWRYGTALPIQRESGNQIEFQPASLTTMVDSPVSA